MVKLKVGKTFCEGQLGLAEGTLHLHLEAALALQLTKCKQELSVTPLLLNRPLFDALPVVEHMGEAQLLEVQAEAVVRTVLAHWSQGWGWRKRWWWRCLRGVGHRGQGDGVEQ